MEILWLVVVILLLIMMMVYKSTNPNLPPGPWNLPIIGYLPWLNPRHPYLTLNELSVKYGPIYGLNLGSVYTVVLSDSKLIKKTFNKDAASGRAPLYLTHGIMKGFGLICAEGSLWKDQRKFVHNTLRTMGAAKISTNKIEMQDLITSNVLELIQNIKSQGKDITLDPLELLRHSLGCAINKMVFGKMWPRDDKTWQWLQHLQEEGTKHIGVAGPLNFLPFLRFLPKFKQTIRFLIEGKHKTHKIYEEIIREQKNSNENSFIQAFLVEKNKRSNEEKEKYYNDQQFNHLLADVFGASLDTTLTTLRWYLLFLAIHPELQNKIRNDLIEISGDKSPSLEDLENLPYFEATVAETQRIRSVVPVGIPHGSTEEIQVGGYTIPKGTMIVPLQWAIHMDSKIWEDPECFRPERFINEEGKFFKPEHFIPFQAGKRMCVGEELAKMFLYLFASSLVRNFDISCKSINLIDLTGDCGITLTPKPHELVFRSVM